MVILIPLLITQALAQSTFKAQTVTNTAPAAPAADTTAPTVSAPATGAGVPAQPVTSSYAGEGDAITSTIQQILNLLAGTNRRLADLTEPGGEDLADGYFSKAGRKVPVATDGIMEKCQSPSQHVLDRLEEAKKFRESCPEAQRGSEQKIVINDFDISKDQDVPYMYIFAQDGTCLGRTAAAYGNGLGQTYPHGCSDGGSHLTPPGFHLTGYHNGESYNDTNSLCLVGLEGQNSCARHVLIHASAQPGAAVTHGCIGVGSFNEVKHTLGEGALVYNYFPPNRMAGGCRSEKGMARSGRCEMETPKRAMPPTATGKGTPVAR